VCGPHWIFRWIFPGSSINQGIFACHSCWSFCDTFRTIFPNFGKSTCRSCFHSFNCQHQAGGSPSCYRWNLQISSTPRILWMVLVVHWNTNSSGESNLYLSLCNCVMDILCKENSRRGSIPSPVFPRIQWIQEKDTNLPPIRALTKRIRLWVKMSSWRIHQIFSEVCSTFNICQRYYLSNARQIIRKNGNWHQRIREKISWEKLGDRI